MMVGTENGSESAEFPAHSVTKIVTIAPIVDQANRDLDRC